MRRALIFCLAALLVSACSETPTPRIASTPLAVEAQAAGVDKFGDNLAFVSVFENNQAVCGSVEKDEGDEQQFIYVRKHFLLQEFSPSGEWESQWFSECDE